MKKICIVTTVPGTLKAFFLKTAIYLCENGWDVTLISSNSNDFITELDKRIRFKAIQMKRGISLKGIIATFEMYKYFKKENFDIVQYSTPNAGLYASLASKLAGIKCRIYHIMGFRYLGFKGIKKQIFKAIDTFACKCSTNVECISKTNYELGIKDGIFSKEKTKIIWNGSTGGVDLNRFDITNKKIWREQVREELAISKEEFVFGFIGRITRDKGIDELIESFKNIKDCKLLIIGDNELFNDSELEHKFQEFYQKENVLVLKRQKNIEKYYATIDMLILPSYREGFGMVVAEAAALGVPSIVSRIPGPLDVIVENKTAIVVEPKNISSLKNKIEWCLNNRDVVKNMEQSCVDYISNTYDSTVLVKKILEQKNYLYMKYHREE